MMKEGLQPAGIPGRHISLWLATTPQTEYPSLESDIGADTVIIGGGIAGLTTALLLQEAGRDAVVIEAGRIAADVTGNTTAKVTVAHGLIYRDLCRDFGMEKARCYAQANQMALERIGALAEVIECDFRRLPAYTYSISPETKDTLREEAESAAKLGLPATYTEEVPLPLDIKGAVRFDNQGIFHPRKYLLAQAERFIALGGRIYENSRVTEIKEGNPIRITANGTAIQAEHAVVATNFPIYDPLMLYTRMKTMRSYALGVLLNEAVPQGLFYSTEREFHSLRPHPYGDGRDIMIIGGEEHKAGQGGDTIARYRRVKEFARQHFSVASVEFSWSTQDNMPMDMVPFIGRLSLSCDRLLVATGFKGWGMTHSLVAATILADAVLERDNPWAELYTPLRVGPPRAVGKTAAQGLGTGIRLLKGIMQYRPEASEIEAMSPGEGRVFEIDGQKVAVSKDDEGRAQAISAACTHMGCIVAWNPAERSWDCPCHGSRYSASGKVLHGPTVRDLKQVDL